MNQNRSLLKRRKFNLLSALKATRWALWSVVVILSVMISAQNTNPHHVAKIVFILPQIIEAFDRVDVCDRDGNPTPHSLKKDYQENQS